MPDSIEVGIAEFRQHLSKFLTLAGTGANIVVTQHGRPLARLVPAQTPGMPFGALAGRLSIPADFDAMPPELIAAIEGEE